MALNNKVLFLHLYCLLLLLTGACGKDDSRKGKKAAKPPKTVALAQQSPATGSGLYGAPVRIANLEDQAVHESSGLVASRANPGLYWTHNDSGDDPLIYAFDRAGKSKGVWHVTGAKADDWEDIAAGPGPAAGTSYLYVGDIGDNGRERKMITVYRFAEPSVESGAPAARAGRRQTAPAEAINLQFPDGSHNAEALSVHPRTGDLYILTKTKDKDSRVYKAAAPFDAAKVVRLAFIGELPLPGVQGGLVTGADISPDGQRIVICDYFGAYEISLPRGDSNFDNIWKQPPARIDLGFRRQGEGICYRTDGKAVLATSEEAPSPLIEVSRKE